MEQKSFKVVVVGDGAVGKTCLLSSFVNGIFPQKYVRTVFDNHVKSVVIEGETVYIIKVWCEM